MPDLRIQIKKGRDAPSVLTCIRRDGTRTWHRLHSSLPVHDLTHYAVETILGTREAFFGLVARGWDIADFEKPVKRGRPPDQALGVEHVVGLLQVERSDGATLPAANFNDSIGAMMSVGLRAALHTLTDDELERIRTAIRDLTERWIALPRGETLELAFDLGSEVER